MFDTADGVIEVHVGEKLRKLVEMPLWGQISEMFPYLAEDERVKIAGLALNTCSFCGSEQPCYCTTI